jgi:hypothetical protein
MNVDPAGERRRRLAFVAAVSAGAAALACVFFVAGFRGILYDSFHYFTLSRIVSSEGLWNFFSRVRTYGYPLFVAAATGFSDTSPEATRSLVAAAQVLIYLGTSLYAARVAERVFGSRRFFYATYAVMAFNPIALIHATELLSDLLSAVLVALALFGALGRGETKLRAFLVFLAAGLSIAVRPANLAALPALALLWLMRARLYREPAVSSLALGALAVALALLPQLHGNVKAYGEWTPLLVDRLYGDQTVWGMAILKYGTLVGPGQAPGLVYRNPFYPEGVASPGQFLRERPLGYLATLALHGFALVDQDLPFTYVTNPRPAWRWPLSLANYALLFLSGLGLAILLSRERKTPPGLYAVGATLAGLALLAVYLPVAVENRFSLPLYMILPPAAVFAALWLAARRSGTIVGVAIAGGGFIAVCVQLSLWLTRQAPALAGLATR